MKPARASSVLWAALLLAPPALAGPAAAPDPKPTLAGGALEGYALAFRDEFDGAAPDEAAWQHRLGTRFWSEQVARNVSVSGGCLRLALRKEKEGGSAYTAGGVISRRAFRHGFYEARFRCPPGAGWHTSFWMMRFDRKAAEAAGDPVQEIDVCEQDSVNLKTYEVNLHRWLPGPHKAFGHRRIPAPDLSGDFHVWGCLFTPKSIDYYLDGKKVHAQDATVLPHGPQNIWLTSIAAPLGGTKAVDDARLPAEAAFDYVRYFAPPGEAPAAR
jgi:beta-glucanase (GH16 family)